MNCLHKTGLYTGMAIVALSLAFTIQPVSAKEKDTVKFGKWEALGKGYLGRANVVDTAILAANLAAGATASSAYTGPVYSLWLGTGAEGVYTVSVSELASGLNVREADIRKLAKKGNLILKNEGKDVPWHYDKAANHVLFAARAHETFYTDRNAFQFALSSKKKKSNKKKIIGKSKEKAPKSSSAGDMRPFPDELHFEVEEGIYWGNSWAVTPEDDDDVDYWPWTVLVSGLTGWDSFKTPLVIPDLDSGSMHFRIELRGRSDIDSPKSIHPVDEDDHHITAFLDYNNGIGDVSVEIGFAQWDGFSTQDIDKIVLLPDGPSSDGSYTLRLESDAPNSKMTFALLNEVDVAYSRAPVAQGGQLWLHDAGNGTQSVSGFSSDEIVVMEDPGGKARFITKTLIEFDGDYKVTFKSKIGKDYLVYEPAAIQVASVTRDIPSSLTSKNNRADYLIIAPRAFSGTARDLSPASRKSL